ncbi:DUF4259 domain-containing protein [Streptomyces sp. NPDC091280]|uniref:DUF4259 domain-containing protein n=1 Tax=Streptomyces sp. NPDC091280 TaxID=3365984 RepID=UPI00382140B3
MGKWGYKPFENDTAADFSGDLDEAHESERLGLLWAALSAVAASDGHVDAGRAEVAIAAAAVVARGFPDGEQFQSAVCGPMQSIPPVSSDFVTLAVRAVNRLLDGDNDLSDDWSGEPEGEHWNGNLRRLGRILSGEQEDSPEGLW